MSTVDEDFEAWDEDNCVRLCAMTIGDAMREAYHAATKRAVEKCRAIPQKVWWPYGPTVDDCIAAIQGEDK